MTDSQLPVPVLSNAMRRRIKSLQEQLNDPMVQGTRKNHLMHEVNSVFKVLNAIADKGLPPRKGLESHAYDLSDCDTYYVGTSTEEKELGFPAYRIITRSVQHQGRDYVEIISEGPRELSECYSVAAQVLGREHGQEATNLWVPMPETLIRHRDELVAEAEREAARGAHPAYRDQLGIRPHDSAPTTRPGPPSEHEQDGREI